RWHTAAPAADVSTPIHVRVEQQAEAAPEAIALVDDAVSLTYRALNQRANRLARRLRSAAASEQPLIIVALDRSVDLVVALLAVLKTGAAYVPLDLSAPDERLAFMVRDTGARIAITDRNYGDRCAA